MNLTKITQTEYSDISENVLKETKVDDSVLKTLHDLFLEHHDFHSIKIGEEMRTYSPYYTALKKRDMVYERADISAISRELGKYYSSDLDPSVGLFLSALVNFHYFKNPANDEYILFLDESKKAVDDLCFRNKANVRIIGNAGIWLCNSMQSGRVYVEGTAGEAAGINLKDGYLQINGNTGSFLGDSMRNGTILVQGNAWLKSGARMQGGIIHVYGESTDDNGWKMNGGELHLHGKIKRDFFLGEEMTGGKIIAYEKLVQFNGCLIKSGEVYEKGKRVYPK